MAIGGGAIYLDCPAATVTVCGTLTANGEDAQYVKNDIEGSGGTGGSILIDAKRLVMTGATLTANGGNDAKTTAYGDHPGGSGGRIALHYDTSVQQAGDIDATTRIWAGNDHAYPYSGGHPNYPIVWTRPGTVWMPDATLLGQLLAGGDRFCGEPVLGTGDKCATVEAINLTQGFVVLGNALTNLTVSGDVTVSGTDARLCVGANERFAAYDSGNASRSTYYFAASDVPFLLSVGGNFNLSQGAKAEFFAAPTNGLGATHGGFVEVTGDLNVTGSSSGTSCLSPACHPANGAGVRFHAANITADAQSVISANERGFLYNGYFSRGPGGGVNQVSGTGANNKGIGAGHGGSGGYGAGASASDIAKYGHAYDDPLRPLLAGSSGTYYYWGGTAGGGIVHLVADGALSLAGTVSADSATGYRGTSGAGGTILLEALTFTPAATTVLSAKGGDHNMKSDNYAGDAAGGGGCIALWLGTPGCGYGEVKAYAEIDAATAFGAATVSVAAGAAGNVADGTHPAEAGTVKAVQATPRGQNLFIRTLDEESFGTVTPAYGSYSIASGAAVNIVAETVVRSDNVRSRCTGYTVETLQSDGSWSDPVSYSETTCAFTMDDGVYRVTFNWTQEAKLAIATVAGGTVSASAAPADAGWYALGAAVTLTAVPDAGYAFTIWGGDVAHAQTTENPIALVMDAAKSVTPAFQTAPAGGQTFTWCGADGANWFDTANWQNGDGASGLPIAGDTVAITAKAGRIVIDRPTHDLKTLTVPNGVTLVATNWTTCIRAASVTVAAGGAITCAGPFADRTDDVVTEIQMSNRVWIAATDLTIEKGGKIDVSNLGYGNLVKTKNKLTRCYGPGCGTSQGTSASYGGIGGVTTDSGTADPNVAYGSAREPTAPGSSGFKIANQNYDEYAACGGGAVRLDLTGTLTLAGVISANGEGGSYRCHSSGSGGSVLVTAKKIVASEGASITALGGNGSKNFSSAGGGGRIALHVDAAAQAAEDVADLMISAGAGERSASETAQPGTVWVSDAKLLTGLNGGLVEGEIFVGDATELAFDSLVITNAFVRFGGSVKRVTVSGDLTLAGTAPRLSFGADRFERQYPSMVRDFYTDEATPFELVVGGDFTVGTGAAVDFYAAQTNGTGVAVGGTVNVGGCWSVASNAVVRSWNHRGTGAAFAFAAKDLTIETNAVFTASAAGFAGSGKVSPSVPGYGPGGGHTSGDGTTANVGAGYGGLGARATAGGAYGQAYGDAARPSLAGSGGGGQYWDGPGGAGGGYLHFTVSRKMTLAGTVSADGECVNTGSTSGGYYRQSMGSGGGILIDARKFAMKPGAVLSAKGANGGLDNKKVPLAGGAGGGGRIAIWTGKPWDESCAAKDPASFEVPLSALVPAGATVTAAGGATGDASVFGGGGTVRCYRRSDGLMLIVR